MNNFYAYNPTKILFGRGMIARIPAELSGVRKILLLSGSGSIKANGVHAQLTTALKDYQVTEFAGIEPNPEYDTCMNALALARAKQVDFIIAAGGGSVMDAAKFIAMAFHAGETDAWDIVTRKAPAPSQALPFACISTFAASGSEYNNAFVISRRSLRRKLSYNAINLYPRFSVLDPETTMSLPWERTAEGIADMFTHVLEQYMTAPAKALLQDRQAEALLLAIRDASVHLRADNGNYDARANLMWCAASAVNGMISRGVPIDWATHMIGHEMTALYDVPHARTLSVLLGGVYRFQFDAKKAKLAQYGRRIWDLTGDDEDDVAHAAIRATEGFYKSLGLPIRLAELGLDAGDAATRIANQFDTPDFAPLGENKAIDRAAIATIIRGQA